MKYDPNKDLSEQAMRSVFGDIVHTLEAELVNQLAYVGIVNDGFNLDYVIVQLTNGSFRRFQFEGAIRLLEFGKDWPWWRSKSLANERKALPKQLMCRIKVNNPILPDLLDTFYLACLADDVYSTSNRITKVKLLGNKEGM